VPSIRVTDIMRKTLSENHNVSDEGALASMKRFIREARQEKVNEAIAKIGLDQAERILGLKDEE